MRTHPTAIREASAGIFLWPAGGLDDTIKGDKFKHVNFSHDRVSFESFLSKVVAGRLSRCFLRSRVEKKLSHLAHRIAGDGTLTRPREGLVHIGRFQYPKTADVLLS